MANVSAVKKQPMQKSYKWQQASERVTERLQEDMAHCISVCDREADIIEYLHYKHTQGQRFVVRAKSNRPLDNQTRLYDYANSLEAAGSYSLDIPQRGGRKGRTAQMTLRYAPVKVLAPERKRPELGYIDAYVVLCQEVGEEASGLTWVLLTSEVVTSREEALRVVQYYEARWKIEVFHYVWKSEGTQVEKLRMQYVDNLEKVAVILAFVAIRLIQLKELGDKDDSEQVYCTRSLSPLQWQLLWQKQHGKAPLPEQAPSMKWAYQALGRLAGWNDSKRTGRISWKTLWEGWCKLDTLVEGFMLAQNMEI